MVVNVDTTSKYRSKLPFACYDSSKSVSICNSACCFYARLVNSGKITNLGVPLAL